MSNIFITGGSRGIGAACVRAFAGRGHRVRFTYEKSAGIASALADELIYSGYDVTAIHCPAQDAQMTGTAITDFSPDILVCCAGISVSGLIQDMTDADYDRVMDVNVRGVFNAVRAAVPGMVRRQSGSIVTVASVWGEVGGSCEALYSASKGAVIAMTKALAKELGPSGIRVNCVSPGNIVTDMTRPLGEDTLAEIAEETPLGRNGTPEDVAAAVLWLAEAPFVTGEVIGVNGGWRG